MRIVLALLLVAAPVLADPHTGAADDSTLERPVPSATLYLRCVGWTGHERVVVDSALALVARVPGVTLDLALEPRDWGTPAVAEALAVAPDTGARLLVLSRLVDRAAPRAMTRARPTSQPYVVAPEAFVHRPTGRVEASESYLAVGGSALDGPPSDEQLAEWALTGALPAASAFAAPWPYSGASGRLVVLRWRTARDACAPLEILARVLEHGRARVVFDVSVPPTATPAERLVGRAIAAALPDTQLQLARLACTTTLTTRKDAEQLLISAGVDPHSPTLLVDEVAPQGKRRGNPLTPGGSPLTPGVRPLTVDGKALSYLDVLSVSQPRSLRQRIAPRR